MPDNAFTDCKVADIELAEFGRRGDRLGRG